MSAPIIAFFNNKGGVGKTSLVFHLSWMYADLGINVLAADLDPQSNLTAAFLEDELLEKFWPDGEHSNTIFGSIEPLLRGTGDIVEKPYVERIDERINLLIGDLELGRPVKAYERWAKRIPEVYSEEILGKKPKTGGVGSQNQMGSVRHYRSLMPMAQEAHKPIFHLRPADGAIGSLQNAIHDARDNFKQLAVEIARRCKIDIPNNLN
ncbi:MAG: AAA family ATPase [Methanothrix sp.]|nr:AAA family ATPase [Methanothrix sp.]